MTDPIETTQVGVEARARECARVQDNLADKVICHRCGATLNTYADVCNADLDEACPGFDAIETAARGDAA